MNQRAAAVGQKARQAQEGEGWHCPQRELEVERLYDEIITHCLRCGTCWQWRNELKWDRLCATGAALVDRYAVAQARLGPQR